MNCPLLKVSASDSRHQKPKIYDTVRTLHTYVHEFSFEDG
jgi:hypothetical protein